MLYNKLFKIYFVCIIQSYDPANIGNHLKKKYYHACEK